MNKRGLLLVVSGFSGAGKGTVMKKLMEMYDDYALSISATTRLPRSGEVDGREYSDVGSAVREVRQCERESGCADGEHGQQQQLRQGDCIERQADGGSD